MPKPICRAGAVWALLSLWVSISRLAAASPSGSGQITAEAKPAQPFIEVRNASQIVNFDLLVANTSKADFDLAAIKLSVFDMHDGVVVVRELNTNGHPPALDALAPRRLRAGGVVDLFQPFTNFDSWVPLGRMHFDLLFMRHGHAAPPIPLTADEVVSLDVHPRHFSPPPACLPLSGKLLVEDGHDLFSHHRRLSLARGTGLLATTAAGVNPNLFALDLMVVDTDGRSFHGDPTQVRNWFTYGAVVRAPESGTVATAVAKVAENDFAPDGKVVQPDNPHDPNGAGNFVTLRHSDGRVTWLLHLKAGSIRVSAGQSVREGEEIGRIGFSGDALFPHLHMNVTQGETYPSQGVPQYFRGFDRLAGAGRLPVHEGQIDTGDLVETDLHACPAIGQ